MVSYLKDTNQVSVYNGSAWVDIAPDVGTPGTYTKVTTDFKGRVTSGTTLAAADIPSLDASKVTSGAFDAARIPNLDTSKITTGVFPAGQIPNLDASKIVAGTLTRPLSTTTVSLSGNINCAGVDAFAATSLSGTWAIGSTGDARFNGQMFSSTTYNQTNTGRAMFIASNGLFGIGASSRRFKENIVDAEIDVDSVLKLPVRKFRYKKSFDENQPEDIGVIAEELVELGLTDFVYFDADGVPDGVAYEKLALALIPVVRQQSERLAVIEDRLDKLVK
jgi:hypothetical protein